MVARDGEHRLPERAEKQGRPLVLFAAPTMGEVAGGDDDVRHDLFDKCGEGLLDLAILTCTRVKIGYMEDPCRHNRMRL